MKYLVLMLSNQPFESPFKTNKWHVATTLAKRGHEVIYVDPPLRFKALKAFLRNPSLNISKLFFSTKKEKNELVLYSPANVFNFWPFSLLNTHLHSRNINRILNQYKGKYKKMVLWIYHFDYPDLESFTKKVDYDLMIYDCVDEYAAFPEYAKRKSVNKGIVSMLQRLDDELKIRLNQKGLEGKAWVLHREKWLSNISGLLFVSAPGLRKKFKKWRRDVNYLPNGADYNRYDLDRKKVSEVSKTKKIPHPRIGFIGAVDSYKVNVALIEKSAKRYSEYQFVIVGPHKLSDPDLDLSELHKLPNVHLVGMIPWSEVPSYFAHFDVHIIPYNLNDYTVGGCFPVKYFESMGMGIPTVVTDLPAYADYDVDGYISKDDDEFVRNIKKALEEDSPERIKKRKAMAKENTWDKKVDRQLKLINEYFDKQR